MHIEFQGTLSPDDYLVAQKLHLHSWRTYGPLGGVLVLLTYGAATTYPKAGVWALTPIGLFVLLLFGSLFAFRQRVMSTWKKNPAAQEEIRGVIDDDELRLRGQSWNYRSPWSKMTSYKMNEKVIVVYDGKRSMRIFPKAFFPDETDWRNFRRLVERTVGKKNG